MVLFKNQKKYYVESMGPSCSKPNYLPVPTTETSSSEISTVVSTNHSNPNPPSVPFPEPIKENIGPNVLDLFLLRLKERDSQNLYTGARPLHSEVENYDTENMNPMQMIGSMMSSGALNDIFQSISSGLNEGNLDLGSMMNSMQSLVGNLNTMVNENQPTTTTPASPTTTDTSSSTTPLLEDKSET